MNSRFKQALAAGAVALGVVSVTSLSAPAYAADDATVYVLHAVPDAVVDVYANGEALLTDFEPGTLTDAVMLPAGDYDLKVVAAGDGADGEAIIEANGVAVPGGANITVVAHLDADGAPVLTPFVNDMSAIAAGDGRLTVRHVAAAPAVDVRAGGEPVFTDLTNPNEASADLAAGTVSADVVLAGTDTVALGPADVDVTEGVHTIVYAWGSAEAANLALAVQTLEAHSMPGGVPGGTGGQAAQSNDQSQLWLIGVGGLAAALIAFTFVGRVRPTQK